MQLRKCRPTNALAEKLIAKLVELGYDAYPGYHGTAAFCIGVKVLNSADAVRLGMDLRTGWGEIGFDTYNSSGSQMVVFQDARVQLA